MSGQMKISIVTGAGSGIGRGIALALLRENYCVAIAGRRAEMLDKTIVEAGSLAKNILAVPTDISNPESVSALFAAVKAKYGRLDLLVNNAGIGGFSTPFESITFEQWKAAVDSNLTGTFLCIREAFKIMKDQKPMGGRIINNGSVSAHVPRPHSAPYTATKHGVSGLTKAASLDGRKFNIACGQIDIGNAASELTQRMSDGILQADGSMASEPRIDISHVASAVVYMASLPLDANVQSMMVMATKMPFIGRG